MRLLKINKVREGRYLKNYELVYENRAGHEKKYEIVSHHEIRDISESLRRNEGGRRDIGGMHQTGIV